MSDNLKFIKKLIDLKLTNIKCRTISCTKRGVFVQLDIEELEVDIGLFGIINANNINVDSLLSNDITTNSLNTPVITGVNTLTLNDLTATNATITNLFGINSLSLNNLTAVNANITNLSGLTNLSLINLTADTVDTNNLIVQNLPDDYNSNVYLVEDGGATEKRLLDRIFLETKLRGTISDTFLVNDGTGVIDQRIIFKEYFNTNTVATTTSQTLIDYVTYNVTGITNQDYIVKWYIEYTNQKARRSTEVEIDIDGQTYSEIGYPLDNSDQTTYSGFIIDTFAANFDITIRFRRATGGGGGNNTGVINSARVLVASW